MAMQILISAVAGRSRGGPFAAPLQLFAERLAGFCTLALAAYETEMALLSGIERQAGRMAPLLVLLDSRGTSFSSEEFAGWLQKERDRGRQSIFFAVGPASGWSEQARGKADLLLSLGRMTLPHELARVVLAEQLYRAFTIMAGHPYHVGH